MKLSAQTTSLRLAASKAEANVTALSLKAGATSVERADNLRIAFGGHSLGKWDGTAHNGKGAFVPSERFNHLYNLDKIGYVAARLTGDNDVTNDASRITKATAIVADKARGETMNKLLASHRQDWGRTLTRAGLETPRGKPAKSSGADDSGKGKVDDTPPETIEVSREAAKALPPAKPDRENVVEYIRCGLAAMALCIEKANQSAAKSKSKAVPPVIQTEISDWIATAKTWLI